MNTVLHLLPGIACGALMCVPMTIGTARTRLRRHRRATTSPATPEALARLPRPRLAARS